MKHLSNKLAVSLLATCVTLSSVHADHPLLEVPSLVSHDHITKHASNKASQTSRVSTESIQPNSKPASIDHQTVPTDQQSVVPSLSDREAQLKAALLLGVSANNDAMTAKEKIKRLKALYKQLKSEYDALSKEAKKLKLQNAALKLQQEEHKAEKLSTWERFKNWMFKLETTKVTTTIITSLVSLICTLLVIIF